MTKNQGFILSLEDTCLKNHEKGSVELAPPPLLNTVLLRVNTHYKNIVENTLGYLRLQRSPANSFPEEAKIQKKQPIKPIDKTKNCDKIENYRS